MTNTPVNVFLHWLESHPRDCRMAVAVDGDSLLSDAGVLGKLSITDSSGRSWYPVVFRGDDLAFRMRFRSACSQGAAVVVLAGSRTGSGRINVSWIADILATNEGGSPLDLSLPAFFRKICPRINFPEAPLRRYKETLMERLEEVPPAAAKIIERWGRPDDWGNGQIAALALLAKHPAFSLADIWPNEMNPEDFVAHGLRLLMATPALASDHSLLLEVFREAAQPQVTDALCWFDLSAPDLAGYLVLRLVAEQYRLQNPTTQLIGLQMFDPDMNLSKLEPLAVRVITRLRSQPDTWTWIEAAAGKFLTSPRLNRVFDGFIPEQTIQKQAEYIQSGEFVPLIAIRHILAILKEFFKNPSPAAIEWINNLKQSKFEDVAAPVDTNGLRLAAGLRLLRAVRRIEGILATSVPDFSHPEGLLEWYFDSGHYGLEFAISRGWSDFVTCGEPEFMEEGQKYFFGEYGDLNPLPASLRERIRVRLDELDGSLAAMIRSNPIKFMQGPRSAASMVRQKLGDQMKQLSLGTLEGRLWILLFDGMRYDTWEEVVRPILSEHFKVNVQPFYAVLPTFTVHARSSLLGGCLPGQGINYQGEATSNEAILAARNLGLTQEEAKSKLRLVTDAETSSALMRMGFKEKDARDVNVLIYSVSDDCHDYSGDLAAFNHRIRATILGEQTQGSRGILDDLLAQIRTEDSVLLTSDHGFIELLRTRAISVSSGAVNSPDETAEIQLRYICGADPGSGDSPLLVPLGKRTYQLAVGSLWFKREGARVFPRYSHGGCSLAEMAIPGALLRRLTSKVSRLAIESIPVQISVEEDAVAEVAVVIRNAGNVDMTVSIAMQDNLGTALIAQETTLKVGQKTTFSSRLTGRYRQTAARDIDPQGTVTAVTVRLRHTDQYGKWRDFEEGTVVIPVSVKPKPTRLETEALKSFDDA